MRLLVFWENTKLFYSLLLNINLVSCRNPVNKSIYKESADSVSQTSWPTKGAGKLHAPLVLHKLPYYPLAFSRKRGGKFYGIIFDIKEWRN